MSERAQLLLELADDELILGWRDSEWTGIAPFLEEDVAFSSIAQNEIGHARALYELAARELGGDADALAFDRRPEEYRCAPLVQTRLVGDWAGTIARHFLYETADAIRLEALKALRRRRARRGRRRRSTARRSTTACTPRCGPRSCARSRACSTRLEAAVAELWRSALVAPGQRPALAARVRDRRRRGGRGGRARATAGGRVRGAVGRDDDGAPLGAGGRAVVTGAGWRRQGDSQSGRRWRRSPIPRSR